nr:hypothetical protein GCM10020092_056930 [Actinoplanes digitatis]
MRTEATATLRPLAALRAFAAPLPAALFTRLPMERYARPDLRVFASIVDVADGMEIDCGP